VSYRDALNICDLHAMAKRRLPRGVYGFLAGGSQDDQAHSNTRAVLGRIGFRPRLVMDGLARPRWTRSVCARTLQLLGGRWTATSTTAAVRALRACTPVFLEARDLFRQAAPPSAGSADPDGRGNAGGRGSVV